MPSIKSLAVLSLAAVGALAGPYKQEKRWTGGSNCMTAAEAQQVATNYGDLIANYNTPLAQQALAENFTDYSEGVNSLIDSCPQGSAAKAISVPLLAASFTNRTAFEVGQGQQPNINFKQLDIWNTCNTVIIRWETTNTAPIPDVRPVIGIIVLEVIKAAAGSKYPWIIDQVFSEFDSAAWLQNLEEAGICAAANPSSPPVTYSGEPAATAAPTAPAAPPTSTGSPTATTAPTSSAAAYGTSSTSSAAAAYSSAAASSYS